MTDGTVKVRTTSEKQAANIRQSIRNDIEVWERSVTGQGISRIFMLGDNKTAGKFSQKAGKFSQETSKKRVAAAKKK